MSEPLPTARLAGARVLVRTATPEDAAAYARYLEENVDHLRTWEPHSAEERSVASRAERIERAHEDRLAGRGTLLFVCEPEAHAELTGVVQVRNVTSGPLFGCAIGYSVDHRAQGTGKMREAVGLVCRWAFDVLGLHRVEAGYGIANVRSARLLEGLGFVREGQQRAYLLLDGRWHDQVSTSLINDQWTEPR